MKFNDALLNRWSRGEIAYIVNKKWKIGRLKIGFEWRSARHNVWGRFGGGWNWALGFQSSGSCVLIRLLVATLSLYWMKKEAPNANNS